MDIIIFYGPTFGSWNIKGKFLFIYLFIPFHWKNIVAKECLYNWILFIYLFIIVKLLIDITKNQSYL